MNADIIAYDRDDRPFLVAEVKARQVSSDDRAALLAHLADRGALAGMDFLLFADYERLRVYAIKDGRAGKLLGELPTIDVLRDYDPRIAELMKRRRLDHQYLEALVGMWLRNLAYNWRNDRPPAENEMATIGTLDRLKGGSTRSEVPIDAHAVR
jgi:hypothetical protein